ncbi:FadR/GntR family transcriptional regulator [Marivita sp.]|uniref:FadR/GntR family transcriptional regulator n=1 Tax=Marivita sp. TaxID=2003365 RepID=UPI003B51A3B0
MKKSSAMAQTGHAGQGATLFFGHGSSPASVVNALGREIVAGTFPERVTLPPEPEMLDRFGISRTALREAYSKLTAKGLLQARPRVGTSVRPRAQWNMLDHDVLAWHLQTVPAEEIATDLYALRRMIEPSAAALAATSRNEADVEAIYTALEAMKVNSKVEADYGFHVAILTATKNPFINAFSSLIRAAMLSVFEMSWRGAEVIKDDRIKQHEMVADAIRDEDPQAAHRLMEELLGDSIKDARAAAK